MGVINIICVLIKFVKYKNVDLKAWDICVKNSINKDVTALSGYLDIACKKWDALILDDYKAVMPLPRINSVLFNNYATNFLVPQLGVFGNGINYNVFSDFIKLFKSKSHKINYNLNKYNYYNQFTNALPKSIGYEFDVYSKENIYLSSKYFIEKRISNNEIIRFVENAKLISNISMLNFDADMMRQILAYSIRNGIGYMYAAYDRCNNIVGVAFFVKSFSKDKLIFAAIKEKNIIKEVFEFLLNNHLKICRHSISIDLGFSDTYFANVFRCLNVKPYFTYLINKN